MDNPTKLDAAPTPARGDRRAPVDAIVPPLAPHSISVPLVISLAAMVIIVAALYLARDVLIPIALAVLLSFLLTPIVKRLRHWGLPRVPAVLVAVGFGSACIATLVLLVSVQAVKLAGKLPEYQVNIEQKVQSLRSTSDGPMSRLLKMISQLDRPADSTPAPPPDLSSDPSSDPSQTVSPIKDPSSVEPSSVEPSPKPVSVEVVTRSLTPMDIIGTVMGTTLGPLMTAGIVFVFVLFFLLGHEDIRNRLVGVLGQRPGQLYVTTKALDDANTRVSRYLLMQLVVNVTYGIAIGVGLYFIKVPNPILWALLTVVLRFVPFIGPIIAGAFPVALAFAVDPGWSMVIWTVLLFAVVELVSNNVLEPWLYGASTGISAVGILLAALFWASLWGPIGLVMSTPLTVCFMVLGRHIPAVRFFTLLLGDQPIFTLHAKIYQRFLARDPDEPDELARKYLTTHTVEEFYGEVLVPVLRLLEKERHFHALDPESRAFVLEHVRDLIEDVAENPDPDPQAAADCPPRPAASVPSTGEVATEASPRVVCVPAHDESDELVGLMLSTLLRRRAIPATTISSDLLAFERLDRLASLDPPAVCICVLPPFATVHARHTVQRIRGRMPDLKIIVGFWDENATPSALGLKLAPAAPVEVVTSLKAAVASLVSR